MKAPVLLQKAPLLKGAGSGVAADWGILLSAVFLGTDIVRERRAGSPRPTDSLETESPRPSGAPPFHKGGFRAVLSRPLFFDSRYFQGRSKFMGRALIFTAFLFTTPETL